MQKCLHTSVLLFLLCVLSLSTLKPTLAEVTTQKTRLTQIQATDRFPKPPRVAKNPNVCVQYTLTVDGKTGGVKLKARFMNKDSTPKKFLFCQMVGVTESEGKLTDVCVLRIDRSKTPPVVNCAKGLGGRTRSFMDSFHFGCKLISLKGNETQDKDYGSGQHDGFKGKKASDFEVTYADYTELPTGASFDEESCSAAECFGKDTSVLTLVQDQRDFRAFGEWFISNLPFDDPYIQYHPKGGTPLPPEYRSFTEPLGVPSSFPATVPQLPRNVPGPVPDRYSINLNLFDLYTMDPTHPNIEASLTLETSNPIPGVFETDPLPGDVFTIIGGEEAFGNLTINRPTGIPEGTMTELTITVHEPDRPGEPGAALFSHSGTFIQDTQPPLVKDHFLSFNPFSNILDVTVTAEDTTTSPLGAEFWFSTDNGTSWDNRPLESLSNLFEEDQQRTFAGSVTGFSDLGEFQFFLTVQDEVFNTTYFGVGGAENVSVVPQPSTYTFGGGGKFLDTNGAVTTARLNLSGIGGPTGPNSFIDSSEIGGSLRAFDYLTRTQIQSASFSFLEGKLLDNGDLMVKGEGTASVNGVLTNIEFNSTKENDVITFEIFDADTGNFLAGGTGEPGRATLDLTITP